MFESVIRQIEPTLQGHRDRLDRYLIHFRREMINDPRLFAYDVQARTQDDGKILLTGFVEFEESRDALIKYLEALGFDRVENRLCALPDDRLGEERFGFVRVPQVLCYNFAEGEREVVTECLLGDPVYLLTTAPNGRLYCHTAEGYLGYVESAAVWRVNQSEFEHYRSGSHVRIRADFRTDSTTTLPAGARLKLDVQTRDTATLELPGGKRVTVPEGNCDFGQPADLKRLDRVILRARQFLGTPYLWGGKTSAGIDCSGLMQVAFACEGLHLPRDSNQQVYVGGLSATRWYRSGMRKGDLLFFLGSEGKIRHTGLYLGENQFLHAASPVVTIGSFDPADVNYDKRRTGSFVFAKRLFD